MLPFNKEMRKGCEIKDLPADGRLCCQHQSMHFLYRL